MVAVANVFDEADFVTRMLDDRTLARRIALSFLHDTPNRIDVLEGHVARGDAELAGREAHGIKGAAANVSAEELRRVAEAMEEAGRRGDLDALAQDLPVLRAQMCAVTQAMRPLVSGGQPAADARALHDRA